ncbi:MAG: hypothetical protein ACRDJ4_15445, partial [Actinomycetota bacterium]
PLSVAAEPAPDPEPPLEPALPAAPAMPAASNGPAPARPAAALGLDQIRTSWSILLERVRKRRRITHALLLAATPAAWAEEELVLSFAPAHFGYHGKEIVAPANRDAIMEAFLETFGLRPRIRTVRAEAVAEPEPEVDAAAIRSDLAAPSAEDPAPAADEPGDPVELLRKGFAAEIVEEF